MPDYSITLDLAHDCIMVRDLETHGAEFAPMECASTIDGEDN